MSLSAAISRLRRGAGIRALPQNDDTRLSRAIRELEDRLETVGSVEIEDTDGFVRRVLATYGNDTGGQMRGRDLRAAARHIFHQCEGDMVVLADNDAIRRQLDRAVVDRPSSSFIRNLIQAVFAKYRSGHPYIDHIVAGIRTVPRERLHGMVLKAIEEDFIDPNEGHLKLCDAIQETGKRPTEVMSEWGITPNIWGSRLVEEAFAIYCERVSGAQNGNEQLDNLLDWALTEHAAYGEGTRSVSNERYGRHRVKFVNALLLPWFGAARPSASVERLIRNLLLATLGDPRFRANGPNWSGVDEQAKQVLVQWLNAASLRQFFDIVTQTMKTSDEKRMWLYRRKFWTAYLPYITDAWVAFGPTGANLAEQYTEDGEQEKYLKYGHLGPENVQGTHAVLIMRIGDTTIAEWSHNGKCRVWKANSSRAPALYQDQYSADALRNGDLEFIHHGNESYGWQGKIADEIYARVQVRVRPSDYHVR